MAPREDQVLAVALAWGEAHTVVPDRFRRGAPFSLYNDQLTYLSNFYLVKGDARWVPDEPVLGPAFRYRRAILIGPQKMGKSPLTAFHCCVEGAGPALFAGWAEDGDGYACADHGCRCGWEYPYEVGEPMGMHWPTPLIQITALSEEQTDNVYDALRPMIEYGPLSDLIPRTGEEFIRLPGGGRIDTVTSSAKSRLGQRVTFVPQDEVGLWTEQNRMTKTADTQYRGLAGMGGRASLNTNAYDPSEDSVAQRVNESRATDIYRQFRQAPASLSFRNKRERRKIFRIVYGDALRENGGHVDLDSIEAEAADMIEHDPAQAARFFGNELVYGGGTWCEGDAWDARAEERSVPDGTPIVLGFDGSDVDDWTAIRAETADGHMFTPTVAGLATIWDPADYGGQVPRLDVDAAVAELFDRYDVIRMYADPPYWATEVDQWVDRHGEKRVIRFSTFRPTQMHAAAERLLTDVVKADTPLTHDGCPITAVHVRNTRKAPRPGGRYVLQKPTATQKIDAAVTSIICHEAACDVTAAGLWPKPKVRRKLIVMR